MVGPVVKTLPFNAMSASIIPGWRVKILHALQAKTNKQTNKQNTKQKQNCNKFNKDFKIYPHLKIFSKRINITEENSIS